MKDLEKLFEGVELSEETKSSIETLIEAKVKELSDAKIEEATKELEEAVAQVQEEKEQAISEAVEAKVDEVVEKVDSFLNYVVTEWAKDNEVAVEAGVKVSIAEAFTAGIKNVLSENNIETTDEDSTAISKLSEEVDSLKSKLDESINKRAEISEKYNDLLKDNIVADICEDLADTQVEKMLKLVEDVEFKNEESFKAKVTTIKESYFPKKVEEKEEETPLVEENEDKAKQGKKLSPLAERVNRTF